MATKSTNLLCNAQHGTFSWSEFNRLHPSVARSQRKQSVHAFSMRSRDAKLVLLIPPFHLDDDTVEETQW